MTTNHCPYCNGALLVLNQQTVHASTLLENCAGITMHAVINQIDNDDV